MIGSNLPEFLSEFLSEDVLDLLIQRCLLEDVGTGDITSELIIESDQSAEGQFLAKGSGILAGLEVATRVFDQVDPSISLDWQLGDGSPIETGQEFGVITGPARAILTAERLALNFLQRMSGIATETARYVAAIEGSGAVILDTRKTAPGLRALDKWAVRLGGGQNHRMGLFDMILIKDNHISAAGGIEEAIEAVKQDNSTGPKLDIEIEATTLDQVRDILAIGRVDRILLDNMVAEGADGQIDTSRLTTAVNLIDGRFQTEASGNVSVETVRSIALTGVDFISSGTLTHSVTALDLSLLLRS
ncbi:MAG: carboxylating nicotinate-nucleotide diphosphorylase [Bacteroidetes bacterium]|nr:carboxylating nicotinate-nucleotide diphosphorylase [Bacteroidota bacterium]